MILLVGWTQLIIHRHFVLVSHNSVTRMNSIRPIYVNVFMNKFPMILLLLRTRIIFLFFNFIQPFPYCLWNRFQSSDVNWQDWYFYFQQHPLLPRKIQIHINFINSIMFCYVACRNNSLSSTSSLLFATNRSSFLSWIR